MLCNIKDKINFNNPVEKLYFTSLEYHIDFLQGVDWKKGDREFGYDEKLIDRNIELGQLWWASMMLRYYAWKKVEQGDFQGCEKIVQKLETFGIQYDHPHMMVMKYESSARKNLKMGLFKEAIEEATQGIESAKRTDVTLMMVSLISLKTSALAMLGRKDEAIQTIDIAHKINLKTDIIPYHLGDLFTAQALIDFAGLYQTIAEGNRSEQSRLARHAAKSVKRCLKNAKKAACHLTESLRLTGCYYALIGKEKKAFACWSKAIQEGERLGALPRPVPNLRGSGEALTGAEK